MYESSGWYQVPIVRLCLARYATVNQRSPIHHVTFLIPPPAAATAAAKHGEAAAALRLATLLIAAFDAAAEIERGRSCIART